MHYDDTGDGGYLCTVWQRHGMERLFPIDAPEQACKYSRYRQDSATEAGIRSTREDTVSVQTLSMRLITMDFSWFPDPSPARFDQKEPAELFHSVNSKFMQDHQDRFYRRYHAFTSAHVTYTMYVN